MNRLTAVAVVVLFTGCVKSVPPVALVPAVEPAPVLSPEPVATADGVREVEQAIREVTVRFAFDRDLLEPEAMRSLQGLARALRKHPGVKVTIAGNADERGTEEYNFFLAQRRADAAREYLSVLGVRDAQLDTISYGAERPLLELATEEAYFLNRRDDITVNPASAAVTALR